MLYYLAIALRPHLGALNVFTYLTTRAGAAALTAFLVSLLAGPTVIRWLRALKVGQYIRQKHVADLHALHKGKAGTPTMGGALILLATLLAVALWGDVTNRLLLTGLASFAALGAVGFLDDFIKLRRKQNEGLSAKAKLAGQIIVGLALGLYLVSNPITAGKMRFTRGDVVDWQGLADMMNGPLQERCPPVVALLQKAAPLPRASADPSPEERDALVGALNVLVEKADLYAMGGWDTAGLNGEGTALLEKRPEGLQRRETQRLNRLLLVRAYQELFVDKIARLHTKVEIPGLKEVFVPLGLGYVFFVVLIIVGASNGVNMTDGLDGLAIGASIVSLLAYTAIAYVVSRAYWSHYLYLVHVPEASELTVFGAAMLGAGLGFLWYNSHPAEVFMGDTGSLALGGALGTMAVLTKQELLLILVGGLFVMEGGSVLLQIASFKLRGKRIFKMAPIHHHFELLGWSESKVIIRFWIIAIVFALMSLATLKLR